MNDRYILAYDLGTGGVKAALFDTQGKAVDAETRAYSVQSPQERWAEQNPDTWYEGFCSITKEVMERNNIRGAEIAGIGFSGQMMACLPVDKEGNALTDCIIWADRRSVQQTEALRERIDEEEYYQITGNKIYPTYPLPKFMWLRENLPELYKRTHLFLQPKDYIVFRLTGCFATDFSDASGTAVLDMKERRWSEKILELAGIDRDKLPEIRASTDTAGKVSREASRETGIPQGVPVVLGAGDGPCGNLGAGVFREGSAYIYLGTSSWVSSTGKKLVCDPEKVLFNICSVDPSMINVYGTMQMGGGSFLWLRDTICALERHRASESQGSAYEYMTEEAATSPPGSNNLLFLPYLRGERSPRWNPGAKGAFLGLTANHTRGDLIRSVMEGVAYNLKIIRDAMHRENMDITQMRVTGGGAESSLWRQIFADVFNERIHVSRLREGANPLGAAIIAGVGLGIFDDFSVIEKLNPITGVQEPNGDRTIGERYGFLYERFNEAYTLLLPLFEKL